MQRLPPGGKKTNFTVYMSIEDKDRITQRAEELDMTSGFYLVNLVSMDRELGLTEHLLSGGLIELVPKGAASKQGAVPEQSVVAQPGTMPAPEDVKKIEQQFAENLSQKPLNLNDIPKQNLLPTKSVAPQQPVMVRPPMKSIQDLVAEDTGPFGIAKPAQVIQRGGAWEEKLHKSVTQDNKSEARMRKEILESLPPVKDKEE